MMKMNHLLAMIKILRMTSSNNKIKMSLLIKKSLREVAATKNRRKSQLISENDPFNCLFYCSNSYN